MKKSSPTHRVLAVIISGALFTVAGTGCEPEPAGSSESETVASPHLVGPSPVEVGRYLVVIGG